MRSLGFTFLLAIVAAFVCGMAGLQWQRGGFDLIFGKPSTPVGQNLYTSFKPDEVARIHVSANATYASFSRQDHVWQTNTPWQDRMDPIAAAAIIRFTLGMRVEDVAPVDKVDPSTSGLGESSIKIKLEDANGTVLAHYHIGRLSSWKAEVEGMEAPLSTVFIQPRDKQRDRHVYLCTGDISSMFSDGLKLLRDHRPLFFHPEGLCRISIHSQQGDMVLGKESPQHPWRIVKPLDLPTDPQAMKRLIEGLYKLRAVKVSDRAEVTLPANATTTTTTNSISITSFGSEAETTLKFFPSETPESALVNAVVSDRPNTVFDLPAKPSAGMVSLSDLPLDVNALRDPTLTHLNVAGLSAIEIIPATGPTIQISREPRQPWIAEIDGQRLTANEGNLYRLLKAITTTRATGFESDAASVYSAWGLDRPVLRLRFHGGNDQELELRFGFDLDGDLFVNRSGTPTVMRLDRSLLDEITIRPHEWRHERLWSLNRVNLTDIVITHTGHEPLLLKYDFLAESWNAARNGANLTAELMPSRAEFLLATLESLHVARWLAPNDAEAVAALSQPALTMTTIEEERDDDDRTTGIRTRTLVLAPAGTGRDIGSYYGIVRGDQNPFVIDAATYGKLTTPLFGN